MQDRKGGEVSAIKHNTKFNVCRKCGSTKQDRKEKWGTKCSRRSRKKHSKNVKKKAEAEIPY